MGRPADIRQNKRPDPPTALDQATTLVLTNAIYFNAKWLHQLNPEFHHPRLLQPAERQPGQRAHHAHLGTVGYYRGDGFTVLELPYTGNQISMILIVPDQGKFGQFEQKLFPNSGMPPSRN